MYMDRERASKNDYSAYRRSLYWRRAAAKRFVKTNQPWVVRFSTQKDVAFLDEVADTILPPQKSGCKSCKKLASL